ncbi:MAG: hypothetical protein OES79_03195, partial [Planctomycetota bacterium]|nr:hypothetical protein [Planctomycetota bacterium]
RMGLVLHRLPIRPSYSIRGVPPAVRGAVLRAEYVLAQPRLRRRQRTKPTDNSPRTIDEGSDTAES